MTRTPIGTFPRRAGGLRNDVRTLRRLAALVVLLMATTAALLSALPSLTEANFSAPWWMAALIAVGFGLAERFVFHLEYRNNAITFSLSEVPAIYALAFLDPITAIVVRMVSGLTVVIATQRPSPHKVLFNGVLFAFETALAFTAVHVLTTALSTAAANDGGGTVTFLIAAAIGVAAASYVGSVWVTAAIACFEGALLDRLIEQAGTSALTGLFNAVLSMVVLTPALLDERLAPVAIIPVAISWVVLMSHGRLAERYRSLEALHDLAGTVVQSLDLGSIVPASLGEAARILRADRATLQLYASDGEVVLTGLIGEGLQHPSDRHDAQWAGVFDTVGAVFYEVDDRGIARALPGSFGPRIAVPIRDAQGMIALLLLEGRSGALHRFSLDDLKQAIRLGEQLAAPLRNSLLHTEMERAALHDSLTGLPNRAGFDSAVQAALCGATPNRRLGRPVAGRRPAGGAMALLLFDLDRFKEINDTLGHSVGDRVLLAFAERMAGLIDDGDVIARLGGDEFAALITRRDQTAITATADSFVRASQRPLELGGIDVVVAVSVGVTPIHDDEIDAGAVIRRADIAMYAAKRERTGFEFYREDIDRRTPERLSLLSDLHAVLDSGGLAVHYMPKIDLSTGTVVGAEALARWDHPTRGPVPPIQFIPLAEDTGLIKQVTVHVLDQSLQQLQGWLAHGLDLSVSVNLSALDLVDDRLPDYIADRLHAYRIPPSCLTLEITESALMSDTPRALATVDRLHALGTRLSLDDFGTGYSSLSYLRRLPVAELKVDRSFVSTVLIDPLDAVIVKSTIDLGHNLGLTVTAEGIDSNEIADRLLELGCDLGQGFGLSRPIPAAAFRAWLESTDYRVMPIEDRLSRRV